MNRKTFLRYSNTPEGGIKSFSREVMKVDLNPTQEFIATAYERLVDKDLNLSFLCPRQSGKTTLSTILIQWEAAIRPCSTIVCVLNRVDIRDLVRSNFERIAGNSDITTCELRRGEYMVGGSKVYIVTAEEISYRAGVMSIGSEVDLMIFDEFFMDGKGDGFRALFEIFKVKKTVVLGTHTPLFRKNKKYHPKWVQFPISWMLNFNYEAAMRRQEAIGDERFKEEFEPQFDEKRVMELQ